MRKFKMEIAHLRWFSIKCVERILSNTNRSTFCHIWGIGVVHYLNCGTPRNIHSPFITYLAPTNQANHDADCQNQKISLNFSILYVFFCVFFNRATQPTSYSLPCRDIIRRQYMSETKSMIKTSYCLVLFPFV